MSSRCPATDAVRLSGSRTSDRGRFDPSVLHALRRQLDALVAGTHEGVYAVDRAGRTTLVTPSVMAMTGRSAAELVGAPIHDILHHSHADGQHYPRETCPIYAACCSGHRERSEEVFWRKDGTCFPIEYTTAPLVQAGEIVGGVVFVRDLAAIAQLRQVLDGIAGCLDAPADTDGPRSRSAGVPRPLLGRSPRWASVLARVERVARTDVPVLLLGESGTGKELVATAIHEGSPRRGRPFVKVNCAAIPPSLAESELFGHERGAFTGAAAQRVGRFEQAADGTLFLDEVGELPIDLQAKLLRVLQEREFERVGGTRVLPCRARVVAATNRDLPALVRAGAFRADLYYRLNVFPVSLPALRDRREDIPLLAEHFLRRAEVHLGRPFRGFTAEASRLLLDHDWPGNVRELANVIERAALLADGDVVDPGSLELDGPVSDAGSRTSGPRIDGDASDEAAIVSALERSDWKVTGPRGAAADLGVHPNTLRYRMRRLGIRRPQA